MATQQVTGLIEQYCKDVKPTVMSLIEQSSVGMYKAMTYMSTEGKNGETIYYVKIQISSEATGYIHVKISKQGDGLPVCENVLQNQTATSPLQPF